MASAPLAAFQQPFLEADEGDDAMEQQGSTVSMKMGCQSFYNRIKLKSGKRRMKQLFDGALPVFVASSFNRAVMALVEAIGGRSDIGVITALNFIYSLFFAHLIGFAVTVHLPTTTPLYRYISRMAVENANFAWNQTLTLVILKWVYSGSNYAVLFAVWIVCIVLVSVVVYTSSYFRTRYLQANEPLMAKLRQFDGEVFSLPLAFSFTLIIMCLVYTDASTNYLTNTDDTTSITTVDDRIDTSLSALYILYAVSLTLVVAALQSYGLSPLLRRICFCCYSHDAYEAVRTESDHAASFDDTHPLGERPTWLTQCLRAADARAFWWDIHGHTKSIYLHLFSTTCAYLVGCAWYSWSILSFQNFFIGLKNGEVIAEFIFAVVITCSVVVLLDKLSVKVEGLLDDDEADDGDIAAAYVRNELLITSGRLTTGWAWGQFVSSSVGLLVPKYDHDGRGIWIEVAAKFFTAIIVLVLGGFADVYLRKLKRKLSSVSRSHSSSHSSSQNNTDAEVGMGRNYPLLPPLSRSALHVAGHGSGGISPTAATMLSDSAAEASSMRFDERSHSLFSRATFADHSVL